MIKVNVIEKEVEEKQILLKDCERGDVVELDNGLTAVAVFSCLAIETRYTTCNIGLVLLDDVVMGESLAQEAIIGSGEGRIKRFIGKLTGIEVTAK